MATRRQPLLVVADPSLISSGLTPDRHSLLQPLWESCANVRFYQGKVRRLIPAALMVDQANLATCRTRGLHQQQNSDGTRWTWYAMHHYGADTNMYIYRWYGPAAELINTHTAGWPINDTNTVAAPRVDFQAWGDWTLWCPGLPVSAAQNIFRYRPGTGVDTLPNAPNALGITKKQNQLLAIGTGLTRRGVAWSDADDITLWAAAADNLAGSLTIEELRTPMRAYARLGQQIACYTEDQMALVYWIGAPYYYGQRVQLDGIGAVGKHAVCSDGRLNYGMSRNGAWQTDGSDYRYIDFGVLSDYFQNTINWNQGSKIVVARNDVTSCIEFHFPVGAGNENTEAWSFEPSTGNWAPVTAYQVMEERVLFKKPLVGANEEIYLLDDNPALAGALSLVTKPQVVDSPDGPGLHLDHRVDEVEIAAKVASNVEFRIQNATDINGPWQFSNWFALDTTMKTHRMNHLPTGTFHKLEFRNTGTNWGLDLQGFAFYGEIEGIKRDVI